MAEGAASKVAQCGFESHRDYQAEIPSEIGKDEEMGFFKRSSSESSGQSADPGAGAFEARLNQGPAGDSADYAGAGSYDGVERTNGRLTAQRAANKEWGKPDEPKEDPAAGRH